MFAVQNWWNDGAFYPNLATRQPTVIGGCVVFNLLLQLQTRRRLTLAIKDKSGMISEISNRQKNA